MQIPGPTLIVTQGQAVSVTLTMAFHISRQHIDSVSRLCRDSAGGVAGLINAGSGAWKVR